MHGQSLQLTRRAQEGPHQGPPSQRRGHRVRPCTYQQFHQLFGLAKLVIGLADDPAFSIHSRRQTCTSKQASKVVSYGVVMARGGWGSHAAVQRSMHLGIDSLGACVEALVSP